jgi:hypothetical protein
MSALVLTQETPDFLQKTGISELTRQLAGKNAGIKRIVPKNGIFRKISGGEEVGKIKGTLEVVIVDASPNVGRIFYEKQWTPEAEPTAPTCFSNDGRTPDESVKDPPSDRCDTCPMNVKGSGMGHSKACRYSRRLALVLLEDFGTALEGQVYQMNLASKSLFGESKVENAFTFENYVKVCINNGKSVDHIVTNIFFNEDNDNQSVLFMPMRWINSKEFNIAAKIMELDSTKRIVLMTPYQADIAKPLPVSIAKPEIPPEPKKRDSKKVEPILTAKADLDSVLKVWADES